MGSTQNRYLAIARYIELSLGFLVMVHARPVPVYHRPIMPPLKASIRLISLPSLLGTLTQGFHRENGVEKEEMSS